MVPSFFVSSMLSLPTCNLSFGLLVESMLGGTYLAPSSSELIPSTTIPAADELYPKDFLASETNRHRGGSGALGDGTGEGSDDDTSDVDVEEVLRFGVWGVRYKPLVDWMGVSFASWSAFSSAPIAEDAGDCCCSSFFKAFASSSSD